MFGWYIFLIGCKEFVINIWLGLLSIMIILWNFGYNMILIFVLSLLFRILFCFFLLLLLLVVINFDNRFKIILDFQIIDLGIFLNDVLSFEKTHFAAISLSLEKVDEFHLGLRGLISVQGYHLNDLLDH